LGNGGEEGLRVGMLGRLKHLFSGADFDEAARFHDGDARGKLHNHRQIVRNQNQGERELAPQPVKQLDNLRSGRDIKRRNGLIGDEKIRAQNQRAGNPDALSLASGKFVRVTVERRGVEPNHFEHGNHARSARRTRKPRFVNRERLADDRTNAHARIERRGRILKNHLHAASSRAKIVSFCREPVLSIKSNFAGIRCDEPQQDARKRRLAAARFADDAESLSRHKRKVDILDGESATGAVARADAIKRVRRERVRFAEVANFKKILRGFAHLRISTPT
jgi:hypothetical protein